MSNHESPIVPALLRRAADTFEQRHAVYGDNYKTMGHVLLAMFPDGIPCETIDDFNRFGLLVQCVYKLTRYASQFSEGGHIDSAHDLCVYASMLEELTDPHA